MIREDTVSLGSIIKIHALKGELLLATELNLDEILIKTEWVFFDYQGQLVPFLLEYLDFTGPSIALLKVEEINSIGQAKEWIGRDVLIPANAIKKIKSQHPSVHILDGYQVMDEKLGVLGTIDSIIDVHNNPLIQIRQNQKEILIPLSDSIIIKIDHKKRIMHIRAPEGLIDLYMK